MWIVTRWHRKVLTLAVCAAVAIGGSGAAGTLAAGPAISSPSNLGDAGAVVSARPLAPQFWVPGSADATVLTYVTTDAFGTKALSTGTVFTPRGTAPPGGWPVISWAHGTSGIGDDCAPSVRGPGLPERDLPYLAKWMQQGYAIVASDYAGLGTPGLHAYLDGRTTAHNVVDMVRAGREFSSTRPVAQRLSRSWAAVGQSQGGGAAIYTARYATEFGGEELDYRGAVGTGTPAYIERLVQIAGPGVPPVAITPALTAYLSYILAGLRYAHPELGIDRILTPTGRKYVALAETRCVGEFEEQLRGVSLGDYFTAPLTSLPRFSATLANYLGMPEKGFDKPFFMGHGLFDTDVPYPTTAAYAATLTANRQPVTFRTYPSDHSGTLVRSQADTIPFLGRLFGK
ncbi:lipase family protein [Gordonia hongkongensis]|uniref:Lipase family protein n=1 Tax=Gordonia hongkongensis TaxID=1701090 RepID=A0AAX3T8U6_9ACTN|nr:MULTISPECIES: lipase family protein [Gordonia]QIK45962.1 lipase [Gordonia terrae]MDF6102649.1 lipase family protein [Gordonia hongkongensis]MDT0222967.1 lipase family protein [Gordonia sp. AC31]WFP25072.1 lipase family protein [Gordonia hongkongensis]WGJ85763.1 lipase family protein [Gordonia sp. SMJS1]